MTRTQVDLPDELYQALSHRSQAWGVSLSELISRLLQDAIASEDQGVSKESSPRTIGAAFAELRRLMQEENYTLEIPPRTDRPNPFATPDDQVEPDAPSS